MSADEFLDAAIAERDAAIERRVREEIAAKLERVAAVSLQPKRTHYTNAANIARAGAA